MGAVRSTSRTRIGSVASPTYTAISSSSVCSASALAIADVNQVLEYGGIFAYPSLESAEHGKLRLQFEGNPMAHIVETAGGASSDGARSLLAVEPTELHQRVPVHVGNASLVERLEAALE